MEDSYDVPGDMSPVKEMERCHVNSLALRANLSRCLDRCYTGKYIFPNLSDRSKQIYDSTFVHTMFHVCGLNKNHTDI